MDTLFEKGAAARADKDNADIAYNSAIANRDAAKDTLDELQNGTRTEDVAQAAAKAAQARASAKLTLAGSRVEDIKAAEAQVEQAQGKVDQIKVQMDELEVKAPVDARVESLDLRPGDIIQPNATAATLLEDNQLYVRIYVPETQIGHIHPGQTVPITVDSFGERAFQGVVEHINQQGEYSPRNLQTADERADQVFASRIGIKDKDGRDLLRAGMAAFIRVPK
jgi:multidrug resistance efflux pump